MRPQPPLGRSAGLVVPLFSLHSSRSAGIGDIGDLAPLGAWMRRAGLAALQLLPVGTLPAGETSPYSALSAMAIDPVYISLADVADWQALGGDVRLPLADQIALKGARAASAVRYAAVRQAKHAALRLAFSLFWDVDWVRTTARAGAFAAYVSWEEWWLGDYALYCALRERFDDRPWTEWPTALGNRDPVALDEARRDLEQEILFHQYVQWIADTQWEAAREQLGQTRLFGDFPFMVSADSADVWANQDTFRFDRTVGTPPDAFSATGQDWGLPVYRWDVMAAEDDRWLRQRARRMARLYDGYRVDHLVGFYRTYSRPLGEAIGDFDPGGEGRAAQAGRADPAPVHRHRRAGHGGRPRAHPRLRARLARALARARLQGAPLGTGLASARASHCWTPRPSPMCRSPRPAPTTSSRSRSGGSCSTPASAPSSSPCSACPVRLMKALGRPSATGC